MSNFFTDELGRVWKMVAAGGHGGGNTSSAPVRATDAEAAAHLAIAAVESAPPTAVVNQDFPPAEFFFDASEVVCIRSTGGAPEHAPGALFERAVTDADKEHYPAEWAEFQAEHAPAHSDSDT